MGGGEGDERLQQHTDDLGGLNLLILTDTPSTPCGSHVLSDSIKLIEFRMNVQNIETK